MGNQNSKGNNGRGYSCTEAMFDLLSILSVVAKYLIPKIPNNEEIKLPDCIGKALREIDRSYRDRTCDKSIIDCIDKAKKDIIVKLGLEKHLEFERNNIMEYYHRYGANASIQELLMGFLTFREVRGSKIREWALKIVDSSDFRDYGAQESDCED